MTLLVVPLSGLDAAEGRGGSFSRASLSGSGATMQLETVPARVSRVVVRPGSKGREAWALGTSTARTAGYSQSSTGQVVFLKYTAAKGWVLTGPPLDARGQAINPLLGSIDLTAAGEGWAVGEGGVMLHKSPRSDTWREAARTTGQTLTVVSLSPDGGGYAVGTGPTILKLSGGVWSVDPAPDMAAQTTELQGVAAVSRDEAWAVATGQVSGVDSTSLLIYRRSASGWSPVRTQQPIFDSPPAKSTDGGINRGVEAGAVAADSRGAWIGGRMYPRSPSNPDGDSSLGDSSRAFVLRYDNRTGEFTSYCPDLYGDKSAGFDLTRMCDEPFPAAPFHVTSLSIVPGGDVFAGGLGLFRFSGKGWYREPNTNGYLISISMGTNAEGFAASPGRSLGAGGLIRSSATTIGHWTASPRPSAIARWAQPQELLLQDVALAGDGSGRAIAVGALGQAIIFSGTAWDSINPIVGYDLHAVGWPSGDTPWAVGSTGRILHLKGNDWEFVKSPTSQSLFSIAFRSASEGVAVGLGGAILSYSSGVWRDVSPPNISNDLYSVIATKTGYVAVGRDGAIVEGTPGNWRLRRESRDLLKRPGVPEAPTLYGATTLGNRVVVGGQDSALLAIEPDGSIRQFEAPLQGTILALAAKGDVLYASLSPNEQKFRGEAPAAQRGTLMRYSDGRWADVGLRRAVTLLRDSVDPSRFDDPIYDLAIDASDKGWGAGGSPADLRDPVEGHWRSTPTSAIYRVAFGSDPAQPASVAGLDPPKPGVAFAAFGESWCGTGLCSSSIGTGTMADAVALQIRDEINTASTQPGGPKFVLFTGNMRRVGIPEELHQFRNYLSGFRIPVFSAVGSMDRFTGFQPPSVPGSSGGSAQGTHDHWRSVFSLEAKPWGHGPSLASFRPAGLTPAPLDVDAARTHYAFDYFEDGVARLRVVVVDSSTRSYGTFQQQNPQEDQGPWLKTVLGLEGAEPLRIPSVVVMNQPPILPGDQQLPNWSPENQLDFEGTVAAARVSAVITGGPRVNSVDAIRGVVPLHIVGGGGAPLGLDLQVQDSRTIEEPSKLPTDGYYHAWHLMRVDAQTPGFLPGQASVADQAFPAVDTLAMHSYYGYRIPAGKTTDISAMARLANGGFSDPDQSKAAYLSLTRSLFRCGYKNQGKGLCIPDSATMPRVRFYSENPAVADFVQRSPNDSGLPRKVGKQVFLDPDGLEGLLCVFKLGRVGINAVAGLHKARIEIEGLPGNGECVNAEVRGVRVPAPDGPPPPKPRPAEPDFFRPPRLRQEVAIVFPPPPAPVVAPAPPGAPGVGRKEEHEVEYETEKHEHEFTALPAGRGRRAEAAAAAWPILGGAALLAFMMAAVAAASRERRAGARAYTGERWKQ